MNVRVKLFALARDLVGADTVELELPDGATVADLRRRLAEVHPDLVALTGHAMFAVGADYAPDDARLTADADIACIPPVSGG